GVVERMGGTAVIEIHERDEETVEVTVEGDELGLLIGPKGATLSALQDLARTVVQRKTGARSGRLLIDVSGYRQRRKEALDQFTDAEWVLLDSSRRRSAFLGDQVSRLGWSTRVRVVRARAEDAGHDPAFRATCQVVTARSFGPPGLTAECGAAFLEVGGQLL